MAHVPAPLGLVSAMITPGILILAAGSLITSTITRLGRITDRTRFIIEQVNQAVAVGDMTHAHIYTRWLSQYAKRSVVIEKSLEAYYIAISLFVGSTLAIALTNFLGSLFWLPTGLVVIGICFLFAGTAALVWETSVGAGMVRQEIANSSVSQVHSAAKQEIMEMADGPDNGSSSIEIVRDL